MTDKKLAHDIWTFWAVYSGVMLGISLVLGIKDNVFHEFIKDSGWLFYVGVIGWAFCVYASIVTG